MVTRHPVPGRDGHKSDSLGMARPLARVGQAMALAAGRVRPSPRAITYGLGFGSLWAVLVVVRPDTTFHLAPPLVAIVVPAVYRFSGGTSRPQALRLVGIGVGIAIATTIVLGLAGLLDGPSLLPFGGAFVESLIGATVGGAVGLVLATRPWPAETSETR